MRSKSYLFILCACLLAAGLAAVSASGDQKAPPLTQLNVQVLGPQRLGPLPPVIAPPGNPQSSAKIHLGKELYFDTRLSADGTISCATCHNPALGWSDAGPTSEGIRGQLGGRRSPPVSNAAYAPLQFWDGRSPSLEDQAKGPIQNPIEMGNTHQAMIQTVDAISGYIEEFREVFGEGPITVDQVADAIAAFERTVVTTDSKFDRYARGDHQALTPLERQGLESFQRQRALHLLPLGPLLQRRPLPQPRRAGQGPQESGQRALRCHEKSPRHGGFQDAHRPRRGAPRSLSP